MSRAGYPVRPPHAYKSRNPCPDDGDSSRTRDAPAAPLRFSRLASAMLTRPIWLLVTSGYTRDDDVVELGVLSGLSYRFHMGEAQAAAPSRIDMPPREGLCI